MQCSFLEAYRHAAVLTGNHVERRCRDGDKDLGVDCSCFPDVAEYTVIADLIIGGCHERDKFGALCRSGGNKKYHQLMNIKKELNDVRVTACIVQCTSRWFNACPCRVGKCLSLIHI